MKNAYSLRRSVDNAYLVRDRDRRLRRELLSVLAVALPLSAAVLVYVWISGRVWDTGYEVLRLEKTLDQRLERERQLRVEAAELSRHDRVLAVATDDLGLAPMDLEQVVFVGEFE